MVLVSHTIREASLLFNRELVSTWGELLMGASDPI
jgi:hypothetical protein